jgi:hypothetical protein
MCVTSLTNEFLRRMTYIIVNCNVALEINVMLVKNDVGHISEEVVNRLENKLK